MTSEVLGPGTVLVKRGKGEALEKSNVCSLDLKAVIVFTDDSFW